MAADPTAQSEQSSRRRFLFKRRRKADVAPETAVSAAAEDAAPKPRRSKLRLAAMALPAVAILGGGGAYGWHVVMGAPATDVAAAEAHEGAPAAAGEHGAAATYAPLPVAVANDGSAVAARDYAIVAVYDDEAILATRLSLYRVKVGSKLPGLGEILSVEVVGDGGTVTGSEATLRAVSVTAARAAAPAG